MQRGADGRAAAAAALQITRSEGSARQKARALELYHEARTQRKEQIRAFEAEYGRVDLSTTRFSRICSASKERTALPEIVHVL